MRKIFFILMMSLCFITSNAQHRERPNFDPGKFLAEMEQYITQFAAITPKEAGEFFPVFREMYKKQRELFDQQRKLRHFKPADEKACKEAILKYDELEIQIKELQQQYHQKFLKILSPSKLFDVLKAEEHFHRQALKRASGGRPHK